MKCELFHDHFQNFKSYGLPKAQLIIADIPYNISDNFYASRPNWWKDGRIENGASDVAGKAAFNSDHSFNLAEFFHFCTRMLKKEPEKGEKDAPSMIVFCSFEQIPKVIEQAQKHGFKHAIPLMFIKNSSPQVLKVNMRIVGATEYALVLYRNRLPKFRNTDENGVRHAIKNWFEYHRDGKEIPRLHPTQKSICLLKRLIEIFTDEGDVIIDPCAGSGSTLRAARELNRNAYGFEISVEFYKKALEQMLTS
jgi:site-specific DNA-methyltransferase (adenine-specific)